MKRKEGIRLRMWNTPVIPRPVAVLHTKGLGMMGSLANFERWKRFLYRGKK